MNSPFKMDLDFSETEVQQKEFPKPDLETSSNFSGFGASNKSKKKDDSFFFY